MSPFRPGAAHGYAATSPAGCSAILCLFFLALLGALPATAADLGESEARGKLIFHEGRSEAGREIVALVGQRSVPVPATATPCANCHGPDGLGRPESGVVPTNITWSRLSRPYGAVSPGGRREHPAYDEEALAAAIMGGVDPGGNVLDPGMPRFRMHPGDLADLVSYLKRLEHDQDPGLSDERIVLGSVVPAAAAGEAVAAVLSAYFSDLNAEGGIYGRRVELLVARAAAPAQALEQARHLVASGQVFALVAPFIMDVEEGFVGLVEQAGMPVIAPFTHAPAEPELPAEEVFYLLSGPVAQGRALVDYAAGRFPDARFKGVVLHGGDESSVEVARGMVAQGDKWEWPLAAVEYLPGRDDMTELATELRDAGAQVVFLAASSESFSALTYAADAAGWSPYVFALGASAGRASVEAPGSFQGRLFLSFPTSPQDHSQLARARFNDFHRRHELPQEGMVSQVSAYVAVGLLREGLMRAGRTLSRERLVSALEELYEFETGLAPPLTYGRNRRTGAAGAHVVGVDLETRRFHPASTWVEPQ